MMDISERLSDVCFDGLPFQLSDDDEERFIAQIIGVFVEEICAGAVVGVLWRHVDPSLFCDACQHRIPIAHVGALASLAEAVAGRLLEPRCPTCDPNESACFDGGCAWWDGGPPFAAAVITRGSEAEWVLASGECECCGDRGYHYSPPEDGVVWACDACTDCLAIARRYDEKAAGTPRLARFKVRP
jgi:hypothetical protein